MSRVETQTGRSISTLPIDDRARSSAIRDDSQVEEAAGVCITWNDFKVSLSESQGTVGVDVDFLAARNLNLNKVSTLRQTGECSLLTAKPPKSSAMTVLGDNRAVRNHSWAVACRGASKPKESTSCVDGQPIEIATRERCSGREDVGRSGANDGKEEGGDSSEGRHLACVHDGIG